VARIEGQVTIRRPLEEVFDSVADESNVYDPRIIRARRSRAADRHRRAFAERLSDDRDDLTFEPSNDGVVLRPTG
jgi:hypothetical protein